MAHQYTPHPPSPVKNERRVSNWIRHGCLYRIEQLGGFTIGLVALLAGIIAILSYFSILPPQLVPLVHWVEHNVLRR
jgi:hypothetical protein